MERDDPGHHALLPAVRPDTDRLSSARVTCLFGSNGEPVQVDTTIDVIFTLN